MISIGQDDRSMLHADAIGPIDKSSHVSCQSIDEPGVAFPDSHAILKIYDPRMEDPQSLRQIDNVGLVQNPAQNERKPRTRLIRAKEDIEGSEAPSHERDHQASHRDPDGTERRQPPRRLRQERPDLGHLWLIREAPHTINIGRKTGDLVTESTQPSYLLQDEFLPAA